uniref:Retrovirus-related Pol polyprotein from transposon TNT 1-94 n=1 Tax=Cannabis sativa TaxID=3483 RepID=A0A803PRG9_CANSA
MARTKFKVDKFTSANDFDLWRIKMKALLGYQGVSKALENEALNSIDDKKKKIEIESKAHDTILLSLGAEVLREVFDEGKALGLWSKFSSIYMNKSLANKLYLKNKLYTLRMDESNELRNI